MVTLDTTEEALVHRESDTKLYFGESDRGVGTLSITKTCLTWNGLSENNTLSVQYPSISLHAISRDTTNFPYECLYCLLESPNSSSDERDPEAEVTEIRFVPQNLDHLKAMYDAVTHCQELNPDPEDEDYDCDDGDGIDLEGILPEGQFFTADSFPQSIELSEEGQAVLQRLQNAMVNVDNSVVNEEGMTNGFSDQFEDADEAME